MASFNFKKHILPHLIAVIVFLVVTVIFYSPIFFESKVIQQNDVMQGLGAGQEINEYREATGEEALWTDSMFGGMPAYLINVLFPGEQIINQLQNVYSLWLARTPDIVFKAMVSFYILLLVFGVRPLLAIAGAISFGLGTFSVISLEAGHIWKVDAIAYMPLVLAGIHLALKGNRIWGFTLTALALSFEIDANHLQITYYLLLLVLCYGVGMLVHAIRNKELPPFLTNMGVVVAATLLAVGTMFGKLWTTMEYSQYSSRGGTELKSLDSEKSGSGGLDRDYAFAWSNTKMETFTLMIPDFAGGSTYRGLDRKSETAKALSQNNVGPQQLDQFLSQLPIYWGEKPFTGGPAYAGAVMCLLFFIGCFLAPKKHRGWLIAATILSIALSWGKFFPAFNDLMFDYFPGYNKFRVVEMAIVIALLCTPLLGFLGLEVLLEKGLQPAVQKKFFIGAGTAVGLVVLLILFAGVGNYVSPNDQRLIAQGFPQNLLNALRDDRASLLRSDAIRSLLFMVAALALIYYHLKKKVSFTLMAAGLALLTTIDLWSADNRYLNEDLFVKNTQKRNYFSPSPADQLILADTSHARVLNLRNPFNDGRTSYFHASIGGYHGAKMQRYQDMIDRHFQNEIQRAIQQLQQGQRTFDNIPALDMLNAKYFLAGEAENAVITNDGALGNAWLVSNIQKVNSPDEEIGAINNIDPANTAILDASKFEMDQTNFSNNGSIDLVKYEPNHLTYQVNAAGDAFAVFSEIYYADGWKALIDGEEADYVRVDYILRGMKIPQGEHTVEFVFDPTSYQVGSTVMTISSILLLISLAGSIGLTVKDMKS